MEKSYETAFAFICKALKFQPKNSPQNFKTALASIYQELRKIFVLYEKASPCGGILFFRYDKETGEMWIYLSNRTDGTGFSLIGGFVECNNIIKRFFGYTVNKLVALYRESKEEISEGYTKHVSEDEFMEYCIPVLNTIVRANDKKDPHNKILDVQFVAYEVSKDFSNFIENESVATEEQEPLQPYLFSLSTGLNFKKYLKAPYMADELLPFLKAPNLTFPHKHELNAITVFLRMFALGKIPIRF